MFLPTTRALLLLGALSVLVVFGFVTPWLGGLALALDALVLILVVVDGRRARRLPLALERSTPGTLYQGEPCHFALRNPGSHTLHLRLRELLEPRLCSEPVDNQASLPPGASLDWRYELLPRRRGDITLAPVSVRLQGPWRLAWSERRGCADQRVRIFPRVHFDGKAGLMLRQARERRLGNNPVLSRGLSSELYALREYHPGDDYRSIHWKATARLRRPLIRENTLEQHQRLVILLDCGRPMASLDGVHTKLDHTMAAVLALLQVVVAQRDSATLVLFSKDVRRVLRVDQRTRSFQPIFEQLYREEADLDEPDYASAAAWCSRSVPRRSLAVVASSVIDLVTAEDLGRALGGLARRHRVMLVNLEDPGLVGHAAAVPAEVQGAFAKTSAMAMLQANRALGIRLRAKGIDVLSTPASSMAFGMVQRYLAIKERRGL
jgi:uncharacterized protein (DUF58 family)